MKFSIITQTNRIKMSVLSENRADEATQQMRYAAVEGKNVLFITCFLAKLLYDRDLPMLKKVAAMKPNIHMVFGNTEDDEGLAQKFRDDGILTGEAIFADMSDDEKAGPNIAEACKATGVHFDAIFSPYEHAMFLVGEVGELLNIPCNPGTAYSAARDKRLARQVCEEKGVQTPRFGKVESASEIEAMVERIGLPLILKPSSGASSDGVYKCNTLEDVYKHFERVHGELTEAKYMAWNPGCEMVVLLEAYIDGDEFDVDVLMWEGECVYANAIDNWPTHEPYFMEEGSNCPSTYTGEKLESLHQYSIDCVKALGFVSGLFHVETKYSHIKDTPLLIEVNPRMGGGHTHLYHNEVWGVDLFTEFFMCSIGIPVNPPRAAVPNCAMGDFDIICAKTGIMQNVTWMDHLKENPSVVAYKVFAEEGDEVIGYDTEIPQWLGHYLVKSDDVHKTIKILKDLIPTFEPPIMEKKNRRPSTGRGIRRFSTAGAEGAAMIEN
ncbi:hypothetical protein SARC_04853 [Sphaeroforma arctica JP610]|uniref:ATP-grasp domain-containing protein n=1 Tax=Sphaeroforma arctica JP610 TaxID=667725 RepID=A0A0L0G208_9EUKA|nr:hypothetical protein SARC_04853 [Sphaeroforma arctica JP610]KNC82874.1 hypothetical protein SARC_04853 [Sphaeroforma arctica JP610]|eukprot:XP_014156776.1 hypothetical protein SARC_04853 [Sphaeroforma arctica JP610]